MADFRAMIFSIDEGGGGSISWPPLLEVTHTVANLQCMPGDLLAALADRLKSEATYVVLNTLTALHTICLNSKQPVHDQLASSKVLKYLERLLNRPPFPGVEMAAAQLLMDCAFLYGQEELGHKSFAALTSTSKHRAMLQSMAASDVAIMLKEDQKLGLPQFSKVTRGLDFQRHFALLVGPLTGAATPPGVATQLARAAVAASYSDDAAAAAAAAASRHTFAAWAERVQLDPQAAAQRVLNSGQHIQADLNALEAAQEACVAAARECAKQQPAASSSSSKSQGSRAAGAPGMVQLRHQLDKAYLAACKASEWREMLEVLVQQKLPDTQLSALLALADKINTVLDGWQQAATTEVFWLLGVNTAGLADGSILADVVAAATAASGTGVTTAAAAAAASSTGPAAAAAAPAARKLPSQQQQQQPLVQIDAGAGGPIHGSSSSYLDLLTGDMPPALSTHNPFLSASRGASGAVNVLSPQQGKQAAAAAAAPTDELQRYLRELGVAGPHSSSSNGYPDQQQQRQSSGQVVQQQSSSRLSHTNLQQQVYPSIQLVANTVDPRMQQQQHPSVSSMDCSSSSTSTSTSNWAGYPAIPKPTAAGSGPGSAAVATGVTPAAVAAAGPSSTGSAAAAAAIAATRSAAAAGDTGDSSGSDTPHSSITNPFAAFDTRSIMKGLSGAQSTSGKAAAAADAAVAGPDAATADACRLGRSSTGGQAPSGQQQQQQGRSASLPQQQLQDLSLQASADHHPSGGPASAGAVLQPSILAATHQQQQQQQQQQQLSTASSTALQARVSQLFQQQQAGSASTTSTCRSCQLPSKNTLEAAVLKLLLEQQQAHELQLQRLQQQHQQQVAEIKAMAVQRFKELQQQIPQQP